MRPTEIANRIIEKSVKIVKNEPNKSTCVKIPNNNAPILNTILNSFLEKITIRKITRRKLSQAGITIKRIFTHLKTTSNIKFILLELRT